MHPSELKQIYEAKAAALVRGPKQERYEASCSVRDIMRCDVDVGGGKIISAGVPSVLGGDDSVPSPGQLMRASLASCLVLGYAVWAARLEVPVEAIDVTVHTIADNRGPFVPGCSVHPGWLSMGYTIRIIASAPEADLMRVIESADRQSPMLDNMNAASRRTGSWSWSPRACADGASEASLTLAPFTVLSTSAAVRTRWVLPTRLHSALIGLYLRLL